MSDCIEHQGYRNARGYGQVKRGLAHRVAWEDANGSVPEGLVLHHICRNKACVNPEHLTPVTNAENRRLDRRTHCRKGHPMEEGRTRCMECNREWGRKRHREKRGAKFGVWRDRKRVMLP